MHDPQRRQPRRTLHTLILLLAAWALAGLGSALAATTVIPGTPISVTLYDTNGGRHQVAYNGVNQVYGDTNAASGITINLAGTRYGFSAGATGGVVGSQLLGITSQSALLGSGSSADPWRVETLFTAGSRTTIKQTVTYVNGQNFLLFRWDVTSTVNVSGVNFFHGVDTFTFNDDYSLAGYSAACNSAYSYNTVGGVSLYQEFVGLTPPSAFQGAVYSTIWNQMRSGTLNNTFNSTRLDNGLALEWDFNLVANQTKTIQQKWAFGSAPCSTTPLASLAGRVYLDANHNASLEPNEGGTGLNGLIAKLIPNGATTALETTPIAADGTYQFPAAPPGSFTVIVDDNATASDLGPYRPPGYLGTEAPTQSRALTVGTANVGNINFGLYAGSTLSGRVFRDNAQASGTANDALQQPGEVGLAGMSVAVRSGSSLIDSGLTDGNGDYALWIPAGSPTSVDVTISPGARHATGSNLGGASVVLATGLNDANASRRSLSFSSGQTFGGYNFGVVPAASFAPDQSGSTTSPGSVRFSHLYRPGTLGAVALRFSSPAGFGALAYLDANCDGTLSPAEHAAPVTGFSVTASWPREADGQLRACALEVVLSVPGARPAGSSATVTVRATQTWAGVGVQEALTVTDTLSVAGASLELTKQVRNVTQNTGFAASINGKPGEVLEYCIELRNLGAGMVSNVVLRDPLPFFTLLVSGSLRLDGASLSDAADTDAGEFASSVAVVRVAALAPGTISLVCYHARIR